MKKELLSICFTIFTITVNSQVGINTNDPKSTLDVSAKRNLAGAVNDNTQNYGVKLPTISRLELSQNTAVYGINQKGSMIYINDVSGGTAVGQLVNVTTIGYYYFDGIVWKKVQSRMSNTVSVSTLIDPNILGYVPSATANATTAGVPTITGTTVTKAGNVTYTTNGHSYAYYIAGRVITWYEAYNAARSLGGYLATFTTDAEWAFVDAGLLSTSTPSGWIGFAKFNWNAGTALVPNPEMKWITGEQPNHDYSAGGVTSIRKSNWFRSGEPNNSGGTEGFVHFYKTSSNNTVSYGGYSTTHPWNDVTANNTGETITSFIVEFQQ
ncbi:hypothetical protein SAMN05443634_11516 [Chishuiella changwenlii]|uniref:C-type lectin domain-containing protein n=1 Tax=Chishuiella changwenlii TaxID=1434701 RepID=A0A1M7CRX6_9FLAO|nr:C-type lectin domain-containing protein [Chishuiella changwenlii]GGE97083.1 hypothetical protein GCM10010984_13210 [Chishuiella changwenlii]SHL70078.1 hypothetical protein SAMN05443634_11516 [Chishuiella changwenlii]